MTRFQAKVVAVTGAASGMGLAMATRFAAEGARVVAALGLFLASDEARHVNGAVIPADGGWAAV